MDREKIEAGIRLVLQGIGIADWQGVQDTPARIAEMYGEIFAGLDQDPRKIMTPIKGEEYDEMVLVKGLPFYSICEHHLLPFFGDAHIAYLPRKGEIIGISKLALTLDVLARRPQLQERLTKELVDIIMDGLKPIGAMVVIQAEHLCMSMRGVKKPHARVVTSAVRGAFRDNPKTRSEMLELIQKP
ncbi:MAG: GTP cyclohydrolase I FolE [bacterium]